MPSPGVPVRAVIFREGKENRGRPAKKYVPLEPVRTAKEYLPPKPMRTGQGEGLMARSPGMEPGDSRCQPEPRISAPSSELLTGQLPWLLEQIRDGIFLIDAAGRCTLANDSAVRLLGMTLDGFGRQPLHDRLHATLSGPPACSLEGCPLLSLLRDEPQARRWRDLFRRRDGTLLLVDCSFRPVVSDGQAGGGILLFSEVVVAEPPGSLASGSRLLGAVSAARDAERHALASELHDGLAQVLTSARAHLDVYHLAYQGEDAEKAARSLARTMEFVRDSVSEVRRLIKALRVAGPPLGDEAER
jgi:PAS domain-containing protein